ncbi:MAG: hypothetical protein KF910_07725 [Brevundimonas sp.]|uniref:hypothetical protein n=1 Tax=Brevundimonas sp. TaxID=1871086 RepID=UPI0025B9939E|nr:hypothetical protein [Brevundimonas sp.]MBX3477481.1 hypothetical protein [Brevundimonas sp.]
MKKTFLIPALVVAAASVAVPAAAQSYGHGPARGPAASHSGPGYGAWQPINQRQRALNARIDMGVRAGQISRREAVRLRSEFNQIVRLEAQYRRGGLTAWERADLDRRMDRLSAQIRSESRDRNGRRY